jgi:chromate transporter
VRDVILLFLKLGLIGFGGPAAHVGMMHNEVVVRRRWLSEQRFLDLLGATNLIPGPNSTEMAIHIGYLRAGWPGLIAGGAAFILPAMSMVLALSWAYVRFGALPQVGWLLYGVKPVVIGIIVQALWLLGRKAVKDVWTGVIGLAVIVLYFAGVNELLLLFAGGLVVMLGKNLARLRSNGGTLAAFGPVALVAELGRHTGLLAGRHTGLPLRLGELGGYAGLLAGRHPGLPLLAIVPFSLPVLFFSFLKIGAVLYGGGYVLIAFLQAEFVERLGWLTQAQLLDAVAIGQVTPGPLFTTATFIGYVLGGVPGGILATVGIFLPAFIFVAVSNPLIPRLRASVWMGAFLDGINAASLGLMAAVTFELARATLLDPLTIALAIAAGALLFLFRLNSVWLVLGGAIIGLLSGRLLW